MTAVSASGLNRPLTSTLQSRFWSGGPGFRHSLRDGALSCTRAKHHIQSEASYSPFSLLSWACVVYSILFRPLYPGHAQLFLGPTVS